MLFPHFCFYWPSFLKLLLPLLQRMKIWQLWLFSVILSMLLTELVVVGVALLLKGEVPFDYLLTGLVASCVVSSLVVAMLSYFLEKITESQLQLHTVIEAVPECVKLLAADGTLLQINHAGLKMLEADALDQIVGLYVQQFVMPEYREAFIALTQRVFEGKSGNLEFEVQGLKGTRHWVATHAVPLCDKLGHITALLAVTRDISEQYRAEQELKKSEQKFRQLVEKAPLPLCFVNNNHDIEYINNRFEEIFGYALQEISSIEEFWLRVCPDEAYRQWAGAMWWGAVAKAIYEKTDIGPIEYNVICKNGTVRIMLISGIVFTEGCLTVCIDITEHRRIENEIRAAKNQLQATLDATPDLLFELDMEGRYLDCHAHRKELLMVPSVELLGRKVSDILPAAAAQTVMAALHEALQQSWSTGKQIMLPLPQGDCWFELSVSVKATELKQQPHFIVLSHDITERKKTELKLRESEQSYKTLADSGQVLIWSSGTDKLCNYFNRIWLEFTGHPFEQEAGNGWTEGVHPDDLQRCVEIYSRAFDQREKFSMECRLRHHSGEYRWLLDEGSPRYNSQGDFIGYIGHCLDITERKHIEEALRLSEARYRSIIEDQNELICRYLPNGRLTFVNGAYSRYYKKKPTELININYIPQIPEPDMSMVLKKLAEISKDNPIVSYSHRIITSDGEIRWQQWSQRGIYSEDDNILEYQAVGSDITERKRAENEKMRLWDILNKSLNEIYIFDAQTFKFQNVNEGALQNLGYSIEELYALTPLDISPECSKAFFKQLLLPLLDRQKEKTVFESVYRRADGSFYPVEVHLQLVEQEGRAQFLAIVNDISERKRTEQILSKTNAYLENLLNYANAPIMVWDSQFRITRFNHAFELLTGYSEDAVLGQSLELFFPPGLIENSMQIIHKALSGEHWEAVEIEIQHRDGTIRTILWSFATLFAPDGQTPLATIAQGQDITERKQIEQALKVSEARFRSIIEISPVPMLLTDGREAITFISPAFSNTFGYELDEVHTLADWYAKAYPDPEYRQWMIETWQAALEQAESEYTPFPTVEVNICCKNGTTKTVLRSSTVISYSVADRYLMVLYDITDLKQSQRELANNKRFNALIEAIPDAIFFKDGESRWLITNEAAKQLFQLHDTPWQGKTEMELAELQPEFRTAHEECFLDDEKTWEAGQLMIFSETVSLKNGQRLECEVRKVPIFNEQGQRQALVVIGRDITEQKKTTEQLNKLALAVEQSSESIVITNLEGQIEYVNAAFTQSTGYSRMEAQNKNPHILASGKTAPETFAAMWAALAKGQAWKGEFINRRKDGTEYVEFAIITPLRQPDGSISHYVAVKEDITEKKRLGAELDRHRYHLEELVAQRTQELMIAKAQAENANQAKSEFLANMSHEIRTPMNAILGFSSILNDLITDATQRYYLDAIHRSGKTLLQLINDILDLSKIEAGKFTLQYTPVSLRALLDDVGVIFSEKVASKSIDFSVSIDENLPDDLLLDESRLRQVMLNLVGNAVKFTEHGFVRIVASVKFTIPAEQVDLSIAIYDSGIGIPKEQQEKIFAAFTQQDNQNVAFGGTGLGLTICKRLLELMHGSISVDSEEGKGSCFTLTLHAVKVVGDTTKIACSPPLAIKAMHFQPAQILLVDDIALNRQLISSYLAEFGELTLIEAQTGAQALSLVTQQRFDLILMDRRLPDGDGDKVCEKIKALPGCADIPVIMITTSILTHENTPAVFYNSLLHKPVNKIELLATLQSFLPLDESAEIISPLLVEKTVGTIVERTVDPEKLPELLELMDSYQETLQQLGNSGGFEIYELIETAEQLLQIAAQYHCSLLLDWANTLKSQAQLFDITNLARTLKDFSALLKQLRE